MLEIYRASIFSIIMYSVSFAELVAPFGFIFYKNTSIIYIYISFYRTLNSFSLNRKTEQQAIQFGQISDSLWRLK